ncbi:M23 family metallopeptidase [Lysobacter silvisoli]|uniref:M23 family metallopeptidase n=1 Tax=Lysobacter silvisoli TaxID=2293254 RepID=UPI00131434E6|nr:M23 family metallopeptidase [Lysobacter silvisoli]
MPNIVSSGLALLAALWACELVAAPSVSTLALPNGCEIARDITHIPRVAAGTAPAFPPMQLEIRTPVAPTAFRAGGYRYLVYELQLSNYSDGPLPVTGIDVLASADAEDRALLTLSGPRLYDRLSPIGGGKIDHEHPLEAGRSVTAYLCVAFAHDARVPARLRHRVLLSGVAATGPTVVVGHHPVRVLASPVQGAHWIADNALALDRHHRPGLFVAGGSAQISRRYAIDWKRRIEGEFQSGDPLDVRSYHAYAQPVYAVADATVVRARDGLPDNVPRTPAGFTPAVPLSMETLAGNTVVLDLGGGQFAHYAHLQPRSVSVQAGQRVRRGQPLGRIGNSGDARWPHLHFQVSTGADIMDSEGLPFAIERFGAKDGAGGWTDRAREFPLGDGELRF